MKKFSVGIAAVIVVLVIFSEFVVPLVMSSAAQSQLRKLTHSDNLTVSLGSVPGLLMLTGSVNRVEIKAQEAYLGDLRVNDTELHGEDVIVNVERFIQGKGFQIDKAGHIDFFGTVTANSLEELINKKVDKLNVESLEITPEAIKIKAKAAVLGKDLKVDFAGDVYNDGNKLYLRAQQVSVKGVSVKNRIAARIFGDILLYDFDRLKFPVKLQTVEQQSGTIHMTFIH